MSKIFVNIGLSLDGYMAPEGMAIEHWDTPEYKHWGAKWGALMGWIINLQYFRQNLQLGPGGETGLANDLIRSTTERIGVNIMGVIDELEIALVPVLFCAGRRLFENITEPGPQFKIDKIIDSSAATHLRYVRK